MKVFVEFLPPDLRIVCFKHEGLKIEAFRSVIKSPYVNISYEKDLSTYPFRTIDEAQYFADLMINEYLEKIKSVEDFFDEF